MQPPTPSPGGGLLNSFVSIVYILCEQNIEFSLFLLDGEDSDDEEGMCVKLVWWIHMLV